MPPLEEFERIERQAHAAQRLLNDPCFVEVMNALGDFHLAALTACPPGPEKADTRDHHHRMIHALREIVDEVQHRSSALAVLEDETLTEETIDDD